MTLLVLLFVINKQKLTQLGSAHGSWVSGLALFVYAAGFSFAYQWLETATGALILFASVQIGMMAINLYYGKKFTTPEWLGLCVAFCGFVYLLLPGLSAPSLKGSMIMAIAGLGWALYTVKGTGSKHPMADTYSNFLRALGFSVVLIIPLIGSAHITLEGAIYGALSGVFASGLGYAIWYKVLPKLAPSIAAVSQLSVPIIAAIGGIVIMGETISQRLTISSLVILVGISLVIFSAHRLSTKKN